MGKVVRNTYRVRSITFKDALTTTIRPNVRETIASGRKKKRPITRHGRHRGQVLRSGDVVQRVELPVLMPQLRIGRCRRHLLESLLLKEMKDRAKAKAKDIVLVFYAEVRAGEETLVSSVMTRPRRVT